MNDIYFLSNDRHNSIAYLKDILLKYNIHDYDIIYNKYGKPYIKDYPVFFNISHTDNVIVVLISDHECGIDIENSKRNLPNHIERYLNKNELKEFVDSADESKSEIFYKAFTRKEALFKKKGCGIVMSLLKGIDTSAATTFNHNGYIISFVSNDKEYAFKEKI